MDIQTNKSLLKYNTFGIQVSARFFTEVNNISDIRSILANDTYATTKKLILGGGSNILFTKDFDGLAIKNNIKGIEVISEDQSSITVKVGAGIIWHQFVCECVKRGYGGLENLSLIPGNVGASPMQNIGAYGVEVKNCVRSVLFLDLKSGEEDSLDSSKCEFGYRTSVFKTSLKGKKIITHVIFELSKKPQFNTSYGAIEKELVRMNETASLESISRAVINIRKSKLPDPDKIGNAGSFFKNPIVDIKKAETLKNDFPDVPIYPAGDQRRKVAAGWLIEKAGWKGKRIENYGVHAKQALVLVNYGGANGYDINQLSTDIQKDIERKFDIILEKEVNIL